MYRGAFRHFLFYKATTLLFGVVMAIMPSLLAMRMTRLMVATGMIKFSVMPVMMSSMEALEVTYCWNRGGF
jgi:hypothetical protein